MGRDIKQTQKLLSSKTEAFATEVERSLFVSLANRREPYQWMIMKVFSATELRPLPLQWWSFATSDLMTCRRVICSK
jgi:hypothetical protein